MTQEKAKMQMMQEAQAIFLEETQEVIDRLETLLLELEANPQSSALINELFRLYHTIKGGAGMLGFSEFADYLHEAESLLVVIRDGRLPVNSALISILLHSSDCLSSFIENVGSGKALNLGLIGQNLQAIQDFGKEERQTSKTSSPDVTDIEVPLFRETYFIHLKFAPDFMATGGDGMMALQELKEFGELIVIPQVGSVPSLENLDPQQLYLWWSCQLHTCKSKEEIEQVLMFYLEEDAIQVDLVTENEAPPTPAQVMIKRDVVQAHANVEAEISEPENKETETSEPEMAKVESTRVETGERNEASVTPRSKSSHSIRVGIERLDTLLNLVGEAIINQSRFTQVQMDVEELDDDLGEHLLKLANEMDRNLRDLQNQVMKIRMVPIGGVFSPMQRLVRDFSVQAQKQIKLVIEGQETELDKTITEKLHGPITHLVRNAMDHGIGFPKDREQKGKPGTGTITLRAFHREGNILIEVIDDGKGINHDRVLAKAEANGFLQTSSGMSPEEIQQLIFLPGLSTAEAVTDISGRGVGMDVVKQEIQALHGSITVESQPGKGSTFRIQLPLTLAIIEGMLVKVGKNIYTIPLTVIVESFQPQPEQWKSIRQKGELIEIRGEYLPLLRLHEIFGCTPQTTDPTRAVVVVVEHVGQRYGLLVDDLEGQQQVIIKNMEENFYQLPGIVGATVLGNGWVSLILDVPGLIEHCTSLVN